MPKLSIMVAGYSYDVTCRAGEEAHFRSLATLLSDKAEQALAALGGLTETRLLLFTALLLADEVTAARASASIVTTPAADTDTISDADVAMALELLADRMEKVALALEDGSATA